MTPSEKWTDPGDVLVPVKGERIRSVLNASRLSASALARAVNERQQTISLITSGKTKRCRRSRLDKIAQALDVPTQWLTGEMDRLPFSPSPGLLIYSAAGTTKVEQWGDPDQPTAKQIADSFFLRNCYNALMRDLERSLGNAEDALGEYARWGWQVIALLHSLTEEGVWKATLFSDSIRHRTVEMGDQLDWTFARLLAPWFRDENQLNIEALASLVDALGRGPYASMAGRVKLDEVVSEANRVFKK